MKNIIALVTVYYPNEQSINNIKAIIDQVDYCYICDNSPSENTILASLAKSKYIFNGKNLGLSLAFNKVLKEYPFQDDDFVIFFDQDSSIYKGYIQSLVNEYEQSEKQGLKIGGIGPNFYNSFNSENDTLLNTKISSVPIKADSIMTSSFLCKYLTLKDIGFWNEEVFLDLSDWDLCWRMKQNGYSCFITPTVTLKHTLGKGEKKLGFIRVKEGNAFRIYYQTRDCLRLISKKYVPFKYKIRFVLMLTVRPIVHLIVLSNKKERIRYFIKGIHDFNKGIYGSL